MMLSPTAPALWKVARAQAARRLLHATSRRGEITKFQMPAMSPTMTEGGIADWKKKEGEAFTAGDVLLEIASTIPHETDKATIDVEAQEDGIMGKIIAQNGTKNVPIGKTIALLAQEGDDISNLEVPPEEPKAASSASASSSAPSSSATEPPPSPPSSSSPPYEPSSHKTQLSHDRPFFPSVLRLLEENNIPDVGRIKGTGIRGMLTKGDVLAYLGKASGPSGSFKNNTPTPSIYKSQAVIKGSSPPPKKALDALGVRNAILIAFLERSAKARTPAPPPVPMTVDSILADYLPPSTRTANAPPVPPPAQTSHGGYLDGLH